MSQPNSQIEQRVRKFYKSQKLSPEKLSELKKLAEPKPQIAPKPTYMRQLYSYAAFAALFFALLAGGMFGVQRFYSNQHLNLVAAEIALNHAKKFNTEFSTPSIASLGSEMHLLDFSPVHPQRMQYSSYELIGARYCTIDSAIAVQIHLEDEGDGEYTLYEFRDPSAFLDDQEKVFAIDDIQVTLWKEGEVVMGLAHRIDE